MLDPGHRTIYTEALIPPAGFEVNYALAATYSLDLTTVLSVPLQLVLNASEDHHELFKDPITLYEALQRASEKVLIFAQKGQILAPRQNHLLFSLLERLIVEVEAPNGGVFHAKFWLICFRRNDGDEIKYRLLLPSKNITGDRAWDVGLILDSAPGPHTVRGNQALINLLERLPEMAVGRPSAAQLSAISSIANDLRDVSWELPDGFESLAFHVLGMGQPAWRPPANESLVVISPFLGSNAVKVLGKTSAEPLAIVSRSEALDELGQFAPFSQALVLHDAAETDDGEDIEGDAASEIGLHAKVYAYQKDDRTHLVVGSANATDAALLGSRNVEVLAELSGWTKKVGQPKHLIEHRHDEDLGSLLVPWRKAGADSPDAERRLREQQLEEAKQAILSCDISLVCREEGDGWVLDLIADSGLSLDPIDSARGWLVTMGRERAVDLLPLATVGVVNVRVRAAASLTGLFAFQLKSGSEQVAFVLNLPVQGLPDVRDQAVLRHIVGNRSGFLRYLLLLLAGLGEGADHATVARAFSRAGKADFVASPHTMPLLEEMVRAFTHDPKRLMKVERLIHDISKDQQAEEILPTGFLEFWGVFREALEGRNG